MFSYTFTPHAPFPTPWVFGRDRQEALLNLVFDKLTDEKSLAFFYCKEGQPLGDLHTRLVVGVGRILKVGKVLRYDSTTAKTYALWDRIIQHSIRRNDHRAEVVRLPTGPCLGVLCQIADQTSRHGAPNAQ